MVYRAYINDFFINNFYFIWTQFFILPTFMFFVICVYSVLFDKNTNYYVLLVITLILYYLIWSILEYYFINSNVYKYYNSPFLYNNLLSNPLNKYHPFIFFTTYLFLYKYNITLNYFNNFKLYQNLKHQNTINTHYSNNKINYYWVVMMFSLYLGAWWALQEGSWGGWWNWDASEVFGLIILNVFLLLLHTDHQNRNYQTKLKVYISILYGLLLTHIILQLSYNLTSHNFGLSILDYGYFQSVFLTWLNSILLLTIITTYIISKLEVFKSSLYFIYPFFHKTLFLKKNVYTIVIVFVTIYIYLISFNSIINNFFWITLTEDLLNKWFWWSRPYLIIPVISYLNFHYITVYSLIFIVVLNNQLLTKWILNTFNLKSKILINLIHLLLILAFVYPTYLLNTIFIFWDLHVQNTINYSFKKIRNNFTNLFFLENLYIYNLFINLQANNNIVTLNSPLWITFSTNFQFFNTTLSDQILEQSIFSSIFNYIFQVTIYDLSTLIIDHMYTLFLIKILYTFFNTNKIIF